MANSIAGGGYGPYDTVAIPFYVSGSGRKDPNPLYLDGEAYTTQREVTKSGKTNDGSFTVSVVGAYCRTYNIQMVAEQASDTPLHSVRNLFYRPSGRNRQPVMLRPIGTMIIFADGHFENNDYPPVDRL